MDQTGELLTVLAGRYEIERELGHGGMAVVYLARDLKHHRLVALKVLRPELSTALGAERFLREIAIAAPLVHPNIVGLYDSGEAAGFLYYVMPYVEGPTLRERLEREVQLPIDEAIGIARQVAAALDYAHAHGVIHRDIKPDNILLLNGHALVADFGLARALSSAASTPLTQDMVVGTPAYMSPEQCSTERAPDARTDVYSLGCVVFEMITGVPPFRGATAQAIIAHQLFEPPPSVCAERESCPAPLDDAVRRALAKVPADRFRTAGEFVHAMEAGGSEPVLAPPRPRRRWRRGRWLPLGAVTAAALLLSAWLAARGGISTESDGAIATDTTRVALLPFEGTASTAAPANELLYEAFARWNGIVLVDPFQVTDAVRRRGRVVSEDDARAVARSLGAGRYVRGRIIRIGDSLSVRAGLYDVDRPAALQVVSARTGLDETGAPVVFHRLADSLLLRGMAADTPSDAGVRRSLAAVQAFATAQRALDDFDLPRADSAFEAARAADPGFSRAGMWLAQVRSWRQLPAAMWREAAQPAANDATVGTHDRTLARALLFLADNQFPQACRLYEELRERNPRDFAAWYGLGQCRTQDRLVVADDRSPTGWRFRSSYGAGLGAYERALTLLPSAHRGFQTEGFATLRELLLTNRNRLIAGYSSGSDSARFLGRIAWMGDSVVVVPYAWDQITRGAPLYPPGFEHALAYQREVFRKIAASWAVALPQASAAKEALALSLEMLGDPAAADTLRRARELATDPSRRVQLGAAEVLVRIKFALPDNGAAVRAAAALGDSLLAVDSGISPTSAASLAPVAEMLGRCSMAVSLARTASMTRTWSFVIPRHYNADASELLVRSALGCRSERSGSGVVDLAKRLQRDPNFEGARARQMVEDVLLVGPSQLSFPSDPQALALLAPSRSGTLTDAMHLASTGNAIAARSLIERISASRGENPPKLDAALPEARLWLALQDSMQALVLLRHALGAVLSYEPRTLAEEPGRSAALVRAAALRAELEAAIGDADSARLWSSVVIDLWSKADPSLQPVVKQLKARLSAGHAVK